MIPRLKKFTEDIVKTLILNKDDLKVNITKTTKNILIQIETNPSDHGRIIGKRGKTINSLKILVNAMKSCEFSDDRRRVVLELIENDDFAL